MTKSENVQDVPENQEDNDKHLIFQLANELYASPLVSVREIIKMQAIKPVPFMVPYFRGILNLRGLIVSVIDLRAKLDLPCPDSNKGLIVVVDTQGATIAVIVDDVHSVRDFKPESIERNLSLKTKIPIEFFTGVAHLEDRLVNVIDITSILASENFSAIKRIVDGQKAFGTA